MLVHEFVSVGDLPKRIVYGDFPKDEMVLVSDDFILQNHEPFQRVEMYCQNLGQRIMGLDYYGITIMDCPMAERLIKELRISCAPCDDLTKLLRLLEQSVLSNKYTIHFGI
jgi:hypothetical protein